MQYSCQNLSALSERRELISSLEKSGISENRKFEVPGQAARAVFRLRH
jgi:hypothetical protein